MLGHWPWAQTWIELVFYHLCPFSAEVDADLQLCCLLCSLLTPELCAWVFEFGGPSVGSPQFVSHSSPTSCPWVSSKAFSDSTPVKLKTLEKNFHAGMGVAAAAAISWADGNWDERAWPSLCPRKFCTEVQQVQKVLCQLGNVILRFLLTSPSDSCSY